jgi:sodium/bile acid cotransporter 2
LKVNIAASVDMRTFCARLDRKSGMAIGVICQFVILPFCGFLIAKILDLEPLYGMALMVIMTSPGGSYSNWWCAVFNADLAMSVAMTGASTLVGVVMLPVNLCLYCMLLYGKNTFTGEHFVSVLISLAIIIIALIIGLGISWLMNSEVARDRFSKFSNVIGIALFVLSIFVSEHKSRTPVWKKPASLHLAIATPIIMAIIVTLAVTSIPFLGLKKPERVAVVIEACYQNPGLATSIVLAMFSGKDAGDAVAVPIMYGTYEALLLGLFCLGAYYANWTFVDCKQVGLIEAIKGNYQNRGAEDLQRTSEIQSPKTEEQQPASQDRNGHNQASWLCCTRGTSANSADEEKERFLQT